MGPPTVVLMDERPTYPSEQGTGGGPRRGRRVAVALLAAGVLAAVPAGAALAGSDGSEGSAAGNGNSPSTIPSQSTTPDKGQQNRGEGGRGECPEKNGQGGQGESIQL
jgi:hypothetical protein